MLRSAAAALLLSLCGSTIALSQGASPANHGNRSITRAAISPNPATLPNAKTPVAVTVSFGFYGDSYQGDCTYQVTWGDGSAAISGNSNPSTGLGFNRSYTHSYSKAGTYLVEVKGTGTTGCTVPAMFSLVVQLPAPSTQAVVAGSNTPPPAAQAGQVAALAEAQAAAKRRADSVAKAAARAADSAAKAAAHAAKGPPPINVDSLIRAAQLTVEQRQRDVKAAQIRLDSANTAAQAAHLAFLHADSSRAACVASNPTRTGWGAQMTLDGYCKMQVDWSQGGRNWFQVNDADAQAQALVATRKRELEAASAAVKQAMADLDKAKATPRK